MKPKVQNHLLDSFKLLAAFTVLHLHTTLGNVGEEWSTVIRLSCRWAVPFFFLSAGYYLAKKQGNSPVSISAIKGKLVNLIGIFIVANIIYIAFSFASGYIWFTNDVKYLFIGTFWHLWFIGSMIFAYLLIWFVDEIWGRSLRYILGAITLLSCIGIAAFGTFLPFNFIYEDIPRFMSGFAFMVIGMTLAQLKLQQIAKPVIILAVIASIALTFVELYLFSANYRHYDIELSFGISFMAISIFTFAQVFKVKKNVLSKIGKRHSLFIYLYHVIVFKLLIKVLALLKINPDQLLIFFPIVTLFILIGTVYLLEKKFGRVFDILNGKIGNWQ